MADVVKLFIGGILIPKFCSLIRKANPRVKIIGLKVPVNYKLEDLVSEARRTHASVCSYSFGKQILIVLDYRRNSVRLRKVHANVVEKLPGHVQARVLALRAEPGGGFRAEKTSICV